MHGFYNTGGETDKNGGTISKAVYAPNPGHRRRKHGPLWLQCILRASIMAQHYFCLMPECWSREWALILGMFPTRKARSSIRRPISSKGPGQHQSMARQVQYGSNFLVSTPDGATISSVVLIRSGAVTHFFDENERFVPLSFTQTAGGLTVTAPANANLAPPGYYMLFIVNSAGVPSIAPFVQIP
jgi:Galactose oxidase-like, Early set domain